MAIETCTPAPVDKLGEISATDLLTSSLQSKFSFRSVDRTVIAWNVPSALNSAVGSAICFGLRSGLQDHSGQPPLYVFGAAGYGAITGKMTAAGSQLVPPLPSCLPPRWKNSASPQRCSSMPCLIRSASLHSAQWLRLYGVARSTSSTPAFHVQPPVPSARCSGGSDGSTRPVCRFR